MVEYRTFCLHRIYGIYIYNYIHRILSYSIVSIVSIVFYPIYLSVCLSISLLTYDENQSHNTWDNHSTGKQSIFETAKAVTLPERLMDFHPWGKSMKMSLHGILTIEETHEINEKWVNWSGEPIR